ncbi:MBL fold metallo-hydrolase [Actinopolymorpha singaporensis]|uniref:Glyoxylase, beta-lactamase superfamily II n=1 Tax=Actinopolymorpha singaporensis TaxID=117157 RepID=A0A1H1PZI2_9ACTN|nr:MBL fold metallo-hydrolase [Actinopolymorpha singaporensis]SDS16622.1 Glyoxylase, beta-lactamase superfamily II [Actinopolymorpha singaporensis]
MTAAGWWTGGPVGPRAVCVLADNPGPMTLSGTNTWVLFGSSGDALVVDPGPADEGHLRQVLAAGASRGGRVTGAVLTHGHLDHSEGARRFAELAGCPLRAVAPAYARDGGLADGDVLTVDDLALRVVATPGHTSDSVSFLVPDLAGTDPGDTASSVGGAGAAVLLTGDTVLGQGTTVVAHPDGALGPYLASLRRLRDLVAQVPVRQLLPGHGPPVEDPRGVLDHYLTHRAERLEQVRAAVRSGARTPREVVERVYAEVDRSLWPAAEQSVRAQLDYLDALADAAGAADA